ncbi:MAG: oligosaccharide flippase family protein [Christensenella sp.]|nr:oligosaccharide flippase family protein [Christensenella sp.]
MKEKIEALWQRFKKNEFWSSVAKLSAGQIIAQAITLAATLVLSRIYTDSDYGNFGIITSTAAIIISMLNLALGSAVMVARTDEDSRRVLTVTFLVQTVLLTVVILGMLALSPVKKFFDIKSIPYAVALMIMAAYAAVSSLCSLVTVYINRLKLNNVLFWNSLITAGCTVFISIPLGFLKFGFIGLVSSAIIGTLLSIIQMMRASFPFTKIKSFGEIQKTFVECRNFIFFQYPSNVMGTVSNNMPNQTLYNIYGDSALGTYAMCNKVFHMPLNLIITPIQTVYFRKAAEIKDSTKELSDFTFGFIKKFMLLALIPAILVMSFGDSIFGFVLGQQWRESGLIAAIMCPYFFFYFCNSCLAYLRVSIGKQKINLVMTVVQLLSALLSLLLVMVLPEKLILSVAIFAVVNTVFNIVDVMIMFVCMKKNTTKYILYSIGFVSVSVGVSLLIRALLKL